MSWVVDIRYDQNDITHSIVHKFFKAAGANTNLDGSENILIS